MNSSMCPYIQTYLQFSTLIKKTAVWKNGRKLLLKAAASQHVELWKTVPKIYIYKTSSTPKDLQTLWIKH